MPEHLVHLLIISSFGVVSVISIQPELMVTGHYRVVSLHMFPEWTDNFLYYKFILIFNSFFINFFASFFNTYLKKNLNLYIIEDV